MSWVLECVQTKNYRSSFLTLTSSLYRTGGHSYLAEPWWWAGMIAMIVGEMANFAAYAFASAILVTPLGALSIIFSAVLAHFILKEKLHIFGVLGCVLCVVGSTTIVLHAPYERDIESVKQVWRLAIAPGFLIYAAIVVVMVVVLIIYFVPRYGRSHMIVYIGICSLLGSIEVMSAKAVSSALKLSFQGRNQFKYFEAWIFTIIFVVCCILEINYLNKALDTFNIAVVSPVHYVTFTTLTILASTIMFKEWDSQNSSQIATVACGFITILVGTFVLHKTRDMGNTPVATLTPRELSPCSGSNSITDRAILDNGNSVSRRHSIHKTIEMGSTPEVPLPPLKLSKCSSSNATPDQTVLDTGSHKENS